MPDGRARDVWVRWWRAWRPFLLKPLRRGALLLAVALVVEYLVVPELVDASKDLYLLRKVNPFWMVAGLVLEGASLFCYGLLTRALLKPEGRPPLSRLFRIDLAAAGIAHVLPAGTLGSSAFGYRMFTAEGVDGNEAAVMMATKGLGSTVVLNVLLWLALVISIPLAGFHRIYVIVAIIGAVLLCGVAALVFGVTHESERARRILRTVGDRTPFLTGDKLEGAIHSAGLSLAALGRDRRTLMWSLTWATLNWLLDAASLWCFVAAFGRTVNPVELFAAYGIANVAGALPITPGGLGVTDAIAPLLLVSFGVTRSVATLGVLGWRLVNFWLPIPVGAAAYISLKVPRGAGLKLMRHQHDADSVGLPARRYRHPLAVPGCGLHADHCPLREGRQRRRTRVGARGPDPGDDHVDQVLNPRASRIQVHPGGGDALLEQSLPRPLERGVRSRPQPHRARRSHPEALLVQPPVRVPERISWRLVGPREPRPDHHRRGTGRQRERDVPRVPHSAVRPHVRLQSPRLSGTLEHGGELGPSHASHHPGGAHRPWPDADLDDVRAGRHQVSDPGRGDHVPRYHRHRRRQPAHSLQRGDHLLLVPVRGVHHEHVRAGVEQHLSLGGHVPVDPDRDPDPQPP
jgi:uncharacterized protein (TIRG00374 family)